MADKQRLFEEIRPGDMVTLENTGDRKVSISLRIGEITSLDLEIYPDQVIKLSSGDFKIRTELPEGDPRDVLMVKPEPPS